MRSPAWPLRTLVALVLAGVLTAAPTDRTVQRAAASPQQERARAQEQERPVFESEAQPAPEPVELDAYAEFRKGGVFISDGQRVRIWSGTELIKV